MTLDADDKAWIEGLLMRLLAGQQVIQQSNAVNEAMTRLDAKQVARDLMNKASLKRSAAK